MNVDTEIGLKMYGWASDLFPLNRSLTGAGVRETLLYFQKEIPEISIHEVASGTRANDWVVPEEWNVKEAYLLDLQTGHRFDFKDNNLHLMGYSIPVNEIVSREELDSHLHTLPDQPNAIPYVTSYYSREWGFCLSENQKNTLSKGTFQVVIDSTLEPGVMNYGELLIPGQSKNEILLSTYICHPSMANNELSGPVVALAISKLVKELENKRFSYRILLIPETIGSIYYISKNLNEMKENINAGWVLTCMGDEGNYSYIPSRKGGTLADRVSIKTLEELGVNYNKYTFLDRGSDERQYCAPGVDLPVASLMKSKYGSYPEYHTSLDNLNFITPEGLKESYEMMKTAIEILESNKFWKLKTLGEPQLGKLGLYPTVSTKNSGTTVQDLMNVMAYCDGENDLIDISNICGLKFKEVLKIIETLFTNELVEEV